MSSRRKEECCASVVGETELAKCLLWDRWPQSGAYHDADPFGTYRTQHDGSVVFEQSLRVYPRFVPCKTAHDIDRLVARVLMSAAKHAHRYLVIDERTLNSMLRRVPKGKVWAGPRVTAEGAICSKALPRGVLVHVSGNVEDFGRLCYDCSGFGVSILAPYLLSAFLVVPETTLGKRHTVVG